MLTRTLSLHGLSPCAVVRLELLYVVVQGVFQQWGAGGGECPGTLMPELFQGCFLHIPLSEQVTGHLRFAAGQRNSTTSLKGATKYRRYEFFSENYHLFCGFFEIKFNVYFNLPKTLLLLIFIYPLFIVIMYLFLILFYISFYIKDYIKIIFFLPKGLCQYFC